ncbi:hypothetical protein L7F22_029524 [Adiantum nelumboides]|nr:hypothetical protein [Adiantum nelumboides]
MGGSRLQEVIPLELMALPKLDILELNSNNLQGYALPSIIPSTCGIKSLILADNHLFGPLTPAISNFSSLQELDLSMNGISGSIPHKICLLLQHLSSLDLSTDLLTGLLLASIALCSRLSQLNLSRNRLDGPISLSLQSSKATTYDAGASRDGILVDVVYEGIWIQGAKELYYQMKEWPMFGFTGIKKNLLSVSSLAKNGLRFIFEDDSCIVRDQENGYSLITTGTLENRLFVLDRYEKQIQACIAETKTQAMQDAELWHARFGHVGYGSLMTLQRHNMVHDLSLLEMPPRHVCEGCVLGKMHRFAFSQDGSVRVTQKLQLVHKDVCGPMRMPFVGNNLYFVTFIVDFSRFCWVYPLKAKSYVFAIFQHYVSMVENQTGCKVQTLRTDRGGEYMSGAFKDFLGKKGIKHQCTMPYTPQQNGVAERKNSSLMEMARCMLKAKNLPHKLWMEPVACATHVLNMCPTRALKTITPYESCSGSKGYRLYNPATNKIFESRDVIFAETTAQPMVAFDVSHMQTQDVFEGFLPYFVENQESQQVDNFDQSFDQHVTPHDVEEIVREEQEVLREEQTLPKWVQKTLQDSKLDAPLPRKTRAGYGNALPRGPQQQVSPLRMRPPPMPMCEQQQQQQPIQILKQSRYAPMPQPTVDVPPRPHDGVERSMNAISYEDKGEEKIMVAEAMPGKQATVAVEPRQMTTNDGANKKEKKRNKKASMTKRKIGTINFLLKSKPQDLIEEVQRQEPKLTWPQLLHLSPRMRRQWSKMVSTRRSKNMNTLKAQVLEDDVSVLDTQIKEQRVSRDYVDGGA